MTQFVGLSHKAQEIINSYIENKRKQHGPLYPSNRELMVSLYSIMPNAKSNIVNLLRPYNVILSDNLSDSDIKVLKDEYKEVARFCFENPNHRRIHSIDKYRRYIPHSLIDLCLKLSEPKPNSSVYVPYSGSGEFAYQLLDCSIEGFEYDPELWAISQIVLDSQNLHHSIKLSDKPIRNDKKYDYIYTSLLGSRTLSSNGEYAEMLTHLITNQLNDGGELMCFVPEQSLYLPEDTHVRKLLMESCQYSLTIITMPEKLLGFPVRDASILYVKKDYKEELTLVDLSEELLWEKLRGHRNYRPNIPLIIDAIAKGDKRYVWTGSYDQLSSHINLHPSRYILEQNRLIPKAGERAYRLDELIDVVDRVVNENINRLVDTMSLLRKNDPAIQNWSEKQHEEFKAEVEAQTTIGIREIRPDNLFDNYLNCVVDYQDIPVVNDIYAHLAPVATDCLLLANNGDNVRVGRLQGVSEDKVVSLDGVLPFRVKTEIVSENFLLRSLLSEAVQKQVEMLNRTARWNRVFTKENIRSIVIHVPNKELQEEACREDARQYLVEADRKLLEQYEDFRRDIHMKKHAIGQTLFNFSNWWKTLQRARQEGNGVVSDTALVGKISQYKVSAIYDQIDSIVKTLMEQVNKFDRGYHLQKERFALSEFIKDYITNNPSTIFEYDYISPLEEDDEKSCVYVYFAKEALKIIFDNIVSNACCHGFNECDKNYIIRIGLTYSTDKCVVDISNNGATLHHGLDPKSVFVYGESSKFAVNTSKDGGHQHCGIGGYEVKQLMREFGGSAEFISNPSDEYPIIYRLTFKIANPNFDINGDV